MIPEAEYERQRAERAETSLAKQANELEALRRQLEECQQESELFFASLANRDEDVTRLEQERDQLQIRIDRIYEIFEVEPEKDPTSVIGMVEAYQEWWSTVQIQDKKIKEAEQERDRLQSALEAVEWVHDPETPEEGEDLTEYLCPWCFSEAAHGHIQKCQRQQAVDGESEHGDQSG